MERKWKLGEDLSTCDSLLDGFTFDDLITAVHSNCQVITPESIRKELKEMLDIQMQDMEYLIKNNMDEIIAAAMEGRE